VNESHRVALVLGEEQHRFALAEPSKKETPSSFYVRRLPVELAICVEQRGECTHISRRGLEDLDLKRFRVHSDKGTRLGAVVNCFCAGFHSSDFYAHDSRRRLQTIFLT